MMVMIGAAAIAVVVIVFIMVNGSGDGGGETPATKPQDVAPASASSPKEPAAKSPEQPTTVKLPPATAGKTPDRPAPPLTAETLDKLDELYREARKLYGEGIEHSKAGKDDEALSCHEQADKLLSDWSTLVDAQLLWQEEADLEDWAQPAEYTALTRRWPNFSSLQKKVGMLCK